MCSYWAIWLNLITSLIITEKGFYFLKCRICHHQFCKQRPQGKGTRAAAGSGVAYWISPACIWLHLICLSPCKRSSIYPRTGIVLQQINESGGLRLFIFTCSERRRASGGLSLEELRRNMQFSPIDRNGSCAKYTFLLQVMDLKMRLLPFVMLLNAQE